jgi:SAM-dependent methyltransferase
MKETYASRQNRIVSALCCPICKNTLSKSHKSHSCSKHGSFKIDELGRPYLISHPVFEEREEEHQSGINWLKTFLKKYPKIYYTVWHVFCPMLMLQNGPRKISHFIHKDLLEETSILDIGSGPGRLSSKFINVDVFPFPEVDIIADAESLPFKDGSVDALVTESMLEHIPRPTVVAKEMVRILKKGGVLYASAPFIHPYHASPDDFNRWTISGLKALFSELEILESGVRSGPWSAFLMFLAYWLGNIFSFGSKKPLHFFRISLC